MKIKLLDYLCCPKCVGEQPLAIEKLEAAHADDKDEITSGSLKCNSCQMIWPILNSIPRFVPNENYAQNFGLQWNRFKRTQLDKFSGLSISRGRFFQVTQWPENLSNQLILDAGCGAGRFTEVALSTGAEVIAFDLSDAVDANQENNRNPRLHLIQADVYNLPLRKHLLDRIYCLGVLQHTPDPQKAFACLVENLKSGGAIAADCYIANADRRLNFQERLTHFLRRYTVHVPPQQLLKIVAVAVRFLLPLKIILRHYLPLGRKLNMVIPIGYAAIWKKNWHLPYSRMYEWSVLETYDGYAPKNDIPQSLDAVKGWVQDAGLVDSVVKTGPNGINVRGTFLSAACSEVLDPAMTSRNSQSAAIEST